MIRILRVLEYEFQDNETAEQNMSHWAVPANGTKNFGKGIIRSATITELNYLFAKDDYPKLTYKEP